MSTFKKWSNTSLTTLQMCGEKFRLKYLEKDYRQSGPAAKRGVAVHGVAKEAHKRQMVELGTWEGETPQMENVPGTEAAVVEAKDLAATEFEKAWKWGNVFNAREKEEGVAKVKAAAKDAAVELSGYYVQAVAPPVVPAAVEREVEIKPKDMDITIMGKIDLIESSDGDVIRDLKTAEKAPWKDAAKVSQQLTMYHMIRYLDVRNQTGTGVMPRMGKLVHVVRTPKTHELSVVTQETTRDLTDVKTLANRIRTAVQAVEKGVFVPADPAAPGSPCSWCEFADGTCVYVRRRGSEKQEE